MMNPLLVQHAKEASAHTALLQISVTTLRHARAWACSDLQRANRGAARRLTKAMISGHRRTTTTMMGTSVQSLSHLQAKSSFQQVMQQLTELQATKKRCPKASKANLGNLGAVYREDLHACCSRRPQNSNAFLQPRGWWG